MDLQNKILAGISTALLLTASTLGGNAMGTKPTPQNIALICTIENADVAPEYSAALCPAFIQAVSTKWPEKTVVLANQNTIISANSLVLELTADILSDTNVNASLRWETVEKWSTQTPVTSDVIMFQVSDVTLNSSMSGRLVTQLLKSNDPFSIN